MGACSFSGGQDGPFGWATSRERTTYGVRDGWELSGKKRGKFGSGGYVAAMALAGCRKSLRVK